MSVMSTEKNLMLYGTLKYDCERDLASCLGYPHGVSAVR